MDPAKSIILLVEDDSNDVLLFQRALLKANLEISIQVAGDGEAAIAYLAGRDNFNDRDSYPLPGLVLLDLKLPRKSGFEVLMWLREQAGLKRLPVVVFSSSNELVDINRAYDLGANSYLVKPVAFNSLLAVIKSISEYWLVLNQRPSIQAA